MSLSTGTRLGPYEVESPIGAGGMGEVYRARDSRLGRTVAIKVLSETLANDREFRERFEREARSISALNHPNICTLYDVGREGSVEFLVLEYLEGQTLASRLQRGPLPLAEALSMALGIAGAIETAHRAGIVHRDLKPANVMLTKSGPKLLDFGLAKPRPPGAAMSAATTMEAKSPIDGGQSQPLTARGSLIGTVQYMAPEQIEGEEADARSDIFAFGAVLYEAVTGRRAFEGKSYAGLLVAILKEDPPLVSRAQALTPPALDFLVSNCLAKNPDARIQTAHDVLLQLQWIVMGRDSTTAVAMPRAQVTWRRRLATALGVLLVAGAALVAGWWLARAPDDSRMFRASIFLPPNAFDFVLSPDGRHLAFSAVDDAGKRMLWVRPLDGAAAVPLDGTEGSGFAPPFWSPDSQHLGFFVGDSLKKILASGGPALTVCQCSGEFGTWNNDDVILLTRVFGPIFRVAAAGGAPAPATTLDGANGETSHGMPFFLPDGRHFLFHVEGTGTSTGTYAASLDAPGDRVLVLEGADVASRVVFANGHLVYVRDETLVAQAFDADRLVLTGVPVPLEERVRIFRDFFRGRAAAFTVSQTGVLVLRTGRSESQLSWFDRSGRPNGSLGAKREYAGDLELSPDGKRLAVSIPDARRNHIWFIDVETGGFRQFTFGDSEELGLRWSADGSRVVYRSIRKQAQGGLYALYQKPSSGVGTEELLVQSGRNLYPDGWSPLGRSLLYWVDDPKTSGDFWNLSLADRKPAPSLQAAASQEYQRVSPDGRWMAYSSNETGRAEVYVTTFPLPRGKWRVSTDGGALPRWRRDGRELFFDAAGTLMTAAIDTTAAGFQVSGVKPLFKPSGFGMNYWYDVSADGQRFLILALDDKTALPPPTMVVNWMSALRR